MADMNAKGRHGRSSLTKLSDDDVAQIRASGATGVELARSFGVSQSLISMVRSGTRRNP